MKENKWNPYMLNQEIKKGQAQMIAQAWQRHGLERKKTSWGLKKIKDVMIADHEREMLGYFTDETFVQTVVFDMDLNAVLDKGNVVEDEKIVAETFVTVTDRPLVTEVYTSSENAMKMAMRRGHRVGQSMSLESGWDFLKKSHCDKAVQRIKTEKPYCLVLAFPCGGFSPLQRLNWRYPERRALRRALARKLMKFAIRLVKVQLQAGRHVIMESPKPSEAWDEPAMGQFLEEHDLRTVDFDQCRFGLRNQAGVLHRKPTRMVVSGAAVANELEGADCTRDHAHAPVIGGSRVTAHAGLYPN